MSKRLSGKPIAKKIYKELNEKILAKKKKPKLVIIFIGEDPAAAYYVKMLEKKGRKIDIEVVTKKFPVQIKQKNLIDEIKKLNQDETVHAVMMQKPLPTHLNEFEIILQIDPQKDVDALHPTNIGKMVLGKDSFIPSTPAAVLELLKFYDIQTSGKNIVILGRSNIVGKPLANLLLRKDQTGNATITVCHSRTKNLVKFTQKADILIAALGKPNFVTAEMIAENAIIIDVGINQIEDSEKGTIYVGDVDYEDCLGKAASLTPVPGGIGSITTAILLRNVVDSAKKVKNSNNFIDGIDKKNK